jgi:hypothetical protein
MCVPGGDAKKNCSRADFAREFRKICVADAKIRITFCSALLR